jgi:hypothetical protein
MTFNFFLNSINNKENFNLTSMPQATNHPTLNSNIKTKFAKNENKVSFGSEIASECEKAIDTYRGCIFLIFSFHKLFS